jgi:threonine dehydrogenase-like Zn-dependent dehydrogenase
MMRAIVLDGAGRASLSEVDDPDGEGELVTVLACGLCGSDVEKLGRPGFAGAVLGHEVLAQRDGGERVVPIHHLPCGD